MRNSEINQKIVALWNKHFAGNTDVYAPLFYDELHKDRLVFVGMNPSFSARGFRTILKDTEYADTDMVSFFKWQNISSNPKLIDDCIKMENYAYQNYSQYFGRPIEIAKKVGLEWQHIDLFLYKETSQNDFMNRVRSKGVLNEFGMDQIKLFEDILVQTEPRCVVVTNATGSEILREYIKDDLSWDAECGFHWFTRGGKKIPMFFTSMLSGQRALDRWSYERLVWHIGQAVKVTQKNTNTSRDNFPKNLPSTRTGYCFNCHEILPFKIFTADGAIPKEYTCKKCSVTSRRMLVWDPQLRQYFNENNFLVHESAGVILINQNSEILLFYRSKFPSAHTIPAGHVDEGEDAKSAALREISEETGISVTDATLIKEDTIVGDSCSRGADIHRWSLYASRVSKVKVELTDEGESYAWFSLDSLPENLTLITKTFLNDVDVLAKLREN